MVGLLNAAAGIEVVAECADGSEVLAVAAAAEPDVVMMDMRMPLTSGADATRKLLSQLPAVRVLMLTGSITSGGLLEAAQAGAVGYLIKGGDGNALITAVRRVAAGGTAWPVEF